MKKLFLLTIIFLLIVSNSFAAISQGKQELGNAKKLLFETTRVLESQNNLIVVDEISKYDWYWQNDSNHTLYKLF